jgi:CubicO group peptidase (beta-lactamase class C family)
MNTRRLPLPLLVLVSTLLVTPVAVLAQEASPESLGFSSERLERVAELMQRQIDERIFPGAVSLVMRDDQIVYFHAQGLMDVETQRPMQKDAVFRIMSMTKPVVAVSILMMVEEGKVRLTDHLSRFIPELEGLAVAMPDESESDDVPAPSGPEPAPAAARDSAQAPSGPESASAASGPESASATPRTVPAEREVTIRDLLAHTAGLMSGGPSGAHNVSIGAAE